jgi:hypothetical protein
MISETIRDLPPTILLGKFSNVLELIGLKDSLLRASREEMHGTVFMSSATLCVSELLLAMLTNLNDNHNEIWKINIPEFLIFVHF